MKLGTQKHLKSREQVNLLDGGMTPITVTFPDGSSMVMNGHLTYTAPTGMLSPSRLTELSEITCTVTYDPATYQELING